jgi:hypothetical protein
MTSPRASLLAAACWVLAPWGCGSTRADGPPGEVGTYLPDSGTFAGDDATAALDVAVQDEHRVEVHVVAVSCQGACVSVEAVASGGHPPYTFAWSDGSRAATRLLCPQADTTYAVTVTDTGSVGELARPAATASASVAAEVLGACADGGGAPADASSPGDSGLACPDPGNAPWTGCETVAVGSPIPPNDAFGGWCDLPSNPGATWSYAVCLPKALLPGQTYSVKVTYDLTNLLGPTPGSGVSASASQCAASQDLVPVQSWPILFTPYTGSFSQTACVTADARYPELLYKELERAGGSLPTYTFTFQICTGCAVDP